MNRIIQIYKNNLYLFWILFLGAFLRVYYLIRKSGDLFIPNLGGDPCYHYNVAYNIANGIGPKTSFIFSYWFYHPEIPAYVDLYGPGYALFLSCFLFINDNFFNLRIANFTIGILSILIAYFIGKKIHSKTLGLLSAFFISINFFHIENSTVVMREIFTLLLTQLFFLLLIYLDKRKLLFFLIGLIVGYISITSGVWPIYILILILYLIIKKNKFSFTYIFSFLFGFMITSGYWIIITKKYFGKFYYSNLDYYPYVSGWSKMMVDRGLPQIDNFWSSINLHEYLLNHFNWLIQNIYKGSLVLSPTFVFFLFFLLIPFCIFGAYKLKKIGFILVFFSIIYFFGLSFASYGLGGNLWPRHFLPLQAAISLLLASGIIPIISFVNKKKENFINNKITFSLIFIAALITVTGIEYKTSYWEKDDSHFYKFGKKIQEKTNKNSVIMYSVAVPDVWCATGRKVVHDIARGGHNTRNRLNEEIEKYKASHIFIDISGENYDYSSQKIENVLLNYKNTDLKKILENKEKGYFFYKILKNIE